MKIEQLKLENFKCFKTEKTFDFGRLTILTGANSSGKSTVMQAILSALQSDGFPYLYSPNGKYINLGDFKEITYNNNKNSIKIALKLQADDNPNFYTVFDTTWLEDKINFLPKLQRLKNYSFDEDGHKEVIIEKMEKELYAFRFTLFNKFDIEKLEPVLNAESSLKKHNIKISFAHLDGLQITIIATMETVLSSPYDKFDKFELTQAWSYCQTILIEYISNYLSDKTNYIGAFRQRPDRNYLEKNKKELKIDIDGEGYIDQIVEWEKRSNGKINKLATVLNQMELIQEVKIKRSSGGRFELLVKPINGHLTSLSNVGFGVSQFLPIIIADLQLPDNSTLFLAEPEIHLHPSVQSKFGQYIVNQINTSDKNYIIETHSEYFLNRIRLAIVKGELKKSDVKVYFLENTKKDTNVYDIDFTKTGEIQNAPATFFETYSMDVMDIALNSFNE